MTRETDWQVRDADFEARVQRSFDAQPLMHFIGARLVLVSAGACVIDLPYREELGQQNGFFHGGIIGTLADNAGGFAAYTLMPANSGVLTVEYKVNLMAPAKGDRLVAEGHVVRAGRSVVVSRADVYVENAAARIHCATMQQTLMTMHGKGVA